MTEKERQSGTEEGGRGEKGIRTARTAHRRPDRRPIDGRHGGEPAVTTPTLQARNEPRNRSSG